MYMYICVCVCVCVIIYICMIKETWTLREEGGIDIDI